MRPSVRATEAGSADSPVQWSATLGRRLRLDGIATLGISTQTRVEQYLSAGEWAVAADLAEYFLDEMTRTNGGLYQWLAVVVDAQLGTAEGSVSAPAVRLIDAAQSFRPGDGDLAAVLAACAHGQDAVARERLELMRVRVATIHDQLVWWIQHLLAEVAAREGDEAARDLIVRTHELVWSRRYALWPRLSALERVQVAAEGLRGHLCGPRRRGDVTITEDGDRYTITLDPCGSCGVLRRGDPDSGRPGFDPAGTATPAGTTTPEPWSWNRSGVGWFAVHSAIVAEWLPATEGRPPMRVHEGCDTDGPCRWHFYRD
jgi:hypothetical protein